MSDKAGRLGGTAIAYPANKGVWEKTLCQHQGSWDYTVVSLYLRTEGLTGPTNSNSEVLASLMAYIRTLQEPWIVLGDWNVDPTELQDTTICQIMRGRRILATGEATCKHGAELDFGVVSRSLQHSKRYFKPHCSCPPRGQNGK